MSDRLTDEEWEDIIYCTPKGDIDTRSRQRLRADRAALLAEVERLRAAIEDAFPSNWTDPLLTGPDAALPQDGPEAARVNCMVIERLLLAVKKRVLAAAATPGGARSEKP